MASITKNGVTIVTNRRVGEVENLTITDTTTTDTTTDTTTTDTTTGDGSDPV